MLERSATDEATERYASANPAAEVVRVAADGFRDLEVCDGTHEDAPGDAVVSRDHHEFPVEVELTGSLLDGVVENYLPSHVVRLLVRFEVGVELGPGFLQGFLLGFHVIFLSLF